MSKIPDIIQNKSEEYGRSSANLSKSDSLTDSVATFTPPALQLKADHGKAPLEALEDSSVVEQPYQFAAEGSGPPPANGSDEASGSGNSGEKPNNTGLPMQLKSGVESLSGFLLDDVNVHYNSSKPAQLKAHAYAQGSDIHLGPGQEKHLPHEAWHVVQQKQGRVQATTQMKGIGVNDDSSLEKEADEMGAKAAQLKTTQDIPVSKQEALSTNVVGASNSAVQRVVYEDDAWIETSKKWGYVRSDYLKEIDNTLSAYNARKNDNTLSQEDKEKLLIDVQEAINIWKFFKIDEDSGEEKSMRLGPVTKLEAMISAERLTILDTIESDIEATEIDDDYTHLSSYGISSKIDYTGYAGQTEQDYQDTKQQMDVGGRDTSRMEVILQMLANKVEEAKLHMINNPDPNGEKTLAVLTAPEWFFMKPGQPFSEIDKKTIVTKVKALSASAPDMVIIPGSILWSGNTDDDQKMLKNTAFSVMNGSLLHEVDKYAEGLDTKPYVSRQQSENNPNRTVANPQDTVRKNNQWMAGGGRVNTSSDDKQDQNKDQSSIFDVGALSFSVEICADHNDKRAKMELEAKNIDVARDGVHVQIIVSAGANPAESRRTTRTGGVAISNDAAEDTRGFYEDGLGRDKKTASSDGSAGNFQVGRAQLPV